MERLIERTLFASRWLMAPMYLGLVGALAILLYAFVIDMAHFISRLSEPDVDDAILGVLSLIDLSLMANLVLIVIFSGYENFVSRMDFEGHEDRPSWQGEVDFSTLKQKIVASIIAISGIHLLEVFMDLDKYAPEKIRWMVIIHLVFVGSGLLLALTDWIAMKSKEMKAK